jgi:hypothetical protein
MMTTTNDRDYRSFISELSDIISECEGAGLICEINDLLDQYESYLYSTPIPESVAVFTDQLIMLVDNCEGAELERELQSLAIPKLR